MQDDDLTAFLATPAAAALGFRQGVIVAWNTTTGSNTISCAGATLTDVPFMVTGSFTTYAVGDSVVLFRQGPSWAIMSKILNPGGVAAIGRNTQASLGLESTTGTNFSLTTSYATKTQLDIAVPAWCNALTVSATLMLTAKNTTASTDFLIGRILFPDSSAVAWISGSTPTVSWASLTLTKCWTGVVTPSSTFSVQGQAGGSLAAWGATAANSALIEAVATFNSN